MCVYIWGSQATSPTRQSLWPTVPLPWLALKSRPFLLLAPQTPGPSHAALTPVAGTQIHPPPQTHWTESPSPRKELECSLIWRYNRLHWLETGHGQTKVPTSKLFIPNKPFYALTSLFSPHMFLPKSPKFMPSSTFSSSLKHPIISLFPCIP